MAKDEDRPVLSDEKTLELAKEIGVTPDQIRQIVEMVGTTRSSIIFHARALVRERKR